MGTTTTTFALNKPTVGGEDNAWGTDWNTNADKIDDLLDGTTAVKPNLTEGQWKVGGTAVTASAAELNVLDGVTATAAELNILDGVTATAAELNKLAGATATTAELNKLAGATATTAQLNFVTGVTSAIQTQLDAKAPLASPALTGTPTAPTAAAGTNTTQLATTAFALANSTGLTLLGTLTTTSGSTQTLSGLVLTSYKQLLFMYNSVRSSSNVIHRIGSASISNTLTGGGGGTYVKAKVLVSLVDGYAYPQLAINGSSATGAFVWWDTSAVIPYGYQVEQTGYTTATTSVSVSLNTGSFNAGSVVVYGVK